MPKGIYSREQYGRWSDAEDEFLRKACLGTETYGNIAHAFNREFPDNRKSRSAIMGRANRKGYTTHKPMSVRGAVTTKNKRKTARIVRGVKRRSMAKLVPVVFKKAEPVTLRDENDRGTANLPSGNRKLNALDPVVIERRKGSIPAIIEERPLTSVPVAECETAHCMWPTSEDVRCLEVCGARVEVGAYCARHANVAYRVLPTARRNSTHGKHNVEHTRRIDGSQYRDALDRDGEWLGRMILDQVVTAPADEPLLEIPHFLEVRQ